jgi:hypothetical protein
VLCLGIGVGSCGGGVLVHCYVACCYCLLVTEIGERRVRSQNSDIR